MRAKHFLFVVLTVLVSTSTAQAKDLSGRFGVGADSSLGLATDDNVLGPSFGFPGLSLVFHATKALGFQLIGSLGSDSFEGDSTTRIGVAFRTLLSFEMTEEANLSAVAGASLFIENGENFDRSRFAAEVGLRPEWFVSDNFSLHTQLGLSLALTSAENEMNTTNGFELDLFGNADLLGNAGFTFYF